MVRQEEYEISSTVISCAWRRYAAMMAGRQLYEACIDPDSGHQYYYNTRTGTTSWEPPLLSLPLEGLRSRLKIKSPKRRSTTAKCRRAPFPTTNLAVYKAWRTQLPKEINPYDATLIRIDVYTAESPLRCLFVKAVGELAQSNVQEGWKLYQSFFAYSASIDGTVRYSVFHSIGGLQKSMVVTELAKVDAEKWVHKFDYFAYYSPMRNATRLNVQEVVNPVRQRISSHKSVRGGWSYKFSFFAYAAFPIQVLQVKNKAVTEESLLLQSMCLRIEDSGVLPGYNKELWVADFSFFGFVCPCPGMTRMQVCLNRTTGQHTVRLEDAACGDWEVAFTFYAYDIPVPHTTRYYVQIARAPTRYKVCFTEALGPWKCLFAFYAYSARVEDQYTWTKEEHQWVMKR